MKKSLVKVPMLQIVRRHEITNEHDPLFIGANIILVSPSSHSAPKQFEKWAT